MIPIKKIKNLLSVFLMFGLIFGSVSMLPAGKASAAAPSVKKPYIKVDMIRFEQARLRGISPDVYGVDGCKIYLNGELYDTLVKDNEGNYYLKGLKEGSTNKVEVKNYKNYKQKQYYNSKTKKWVNKKPSKKQWKGKKTRYVKKTAYSSPGKYTFTMKTRKTARTDIDNIRAEALQSMREYAADAFEDTPEFVMEDDLCDFAQMLAEMYDDNNPHNLIDPFTWGKMNGIKTRLDWSDDSAYDIYSFDKKGIEKAVDQSGQYGTVAEWANPLYHDWHIGIGYYNGRYEMIYLGDEKYEVLQQLYEEYPDIMPQR